MDNKDLKETALMNLLESASNLQQIAECRATDLIKLNSYNSGYSSYAVTFETGFIRVYFVDNYNCTERDTQYISLEDLALTDEQWEVRLNGLKETRVKQAEKEAALKIKNDLKAKEWEYEKLKKELGK